jgi:hypothetical protein
VTVAYGVLCPHGRTPQLARRAPSAGGSCVCSTHAIAAGCWSSSSVAVHADRGLSTLTVAEATNAAVALPSFTPGTTGTLPVTATKINQSEQSTVMLKATDVAASSTSCAPAVVTIGLKRGERPAEVLRHVADSESHRSLVNGTPGVDRLRIRVNGHQFELKDLDDGPSRTRARRTPVPPHEASRHNRRRGATQRASDDVVRFTVILCRVSQAG